jgi:hypothetical protein
LEVIEVDPVLRYLPCDCLGTETGGPAVFNTTLGLSIERLPEGESLSQRWKMASEIPLVSVDDM